jgi:hypothetical protein
MKFSGEVRVERRLTAKVYAAKDRMVTYQRHIIFGTLIMNRLAITDLTGIRVYLVAAASFNSPTMLNGGACLLFPALILGLLQYSLNLFPPSMYAMVVLR